jgi:hypothetical protein
VLEVFLLDLARVVQLITSNPLLERCATELEAEADHLLATVAAKDEEVRSDLVAVRRELPGEDAPEVGQESQTEDEDDRSALSRFDAIASGAADFKTIAADRLADTSKTAEMVRCLMEVEADVPKSAGVDPKKFKQRVRGLRDRRTVLHRAAMNVERRHAGAIWKRFRAFPALVNPEPTAEIDSLFLVEMLAQGALGAPFHAALYGQTADGKSASEVHRGLMKGRTARQEDLKLLENEILIRLGQRVSREWSIRRYAERCVRLRAEELRELVTSTRAIRRREKLLTADAAAYLFDQGHDVWTEVSVGSSRPDIAQLNARPGGLVVEAKIFGSRTTALSAVCLGIRQLQSYIARLHPFVPAVDGVLLLFRLGGETIVFPETWQLGDHFLQIICVDIAPAAASGSSGPPSIVLSSNDISARLAVPETTKRSESKKRR